MRFQCYLVLLYRYYKSPDKNFEAVADLGNGERARRDMKRGDKTKERTQQGSMGPVNRHLVSTQLGPQKSEQSTQVLKPNLRAAGWYWYDHFFSDLDWTLLLRTGKPTSSLCVNTRFNSWTEPSGRPQVGLAWMVELPKGESTPGDPIALISSPPSPQLVKTKCI